MKKYQGWKVKTLSQAARTSLIRSVTSSISTYAMSSYLLPKCISNQLDTLHRKFWWGYNDQNHGCYLNGWDSLCKPKASGGIGIKRSIDFNKALISKLTWDVATNANKQWVIMLKNKYLRGQDFFFMQPPKQASITC
jgi:hypothetical protein